jgi:hypothetical protein
VSNLCACGCKTRVRAKNNKGKRGGIKFAPGHNQFRTEIVERVPYRGKRKPPQVKLFEGKRPLSLRRTGESDVSHERRSGSRHPSGALRN